MSDQPQEPQQFVLQPVVTVQELGVPRVVMPEQTAAQAASEFFGCGCDCGCPQHNRPGPKPRGGKR